MVDRSLDSFSTRSELVVGGQRFSYFSLNKLGAKLSTDLGQLPYSLKILLENLLRNEDGRSVVGRDIRALAAHGPVKAGPEGQPAVFVEQQ